MLVSRKFQRDVVGHKPETHRDYCEVRLAQPMAINTNKWRKRTRLFHLRYVSRSVSRTACRSSQRGGKRRGSPRSVATSTSEYFSVGSNEGLSPTYCWYFATHVGHVGCNVGLLPRPLKKENLTLPNDPVHRRMCATASIQRRAGWTSHESGFRTFVTARDVCTPPTTIHYTDLVPARRRLVVKAANPSRK